MVHIVAHSIWRTCSTYLWSKAKSSPGCTAYYEPFNEALSAKVKPIGANSLGWNSRHPETLNYFAEILSAYKHINIQEFPQQNGEWSRCEYFSYSDAQRKHVENLMRAFLESKDYSCYWNFNRGVSKISAIHDSIFSLSGANPISLLIYREPSQHLASFMYQSVNTNYYFEERFYNLWLAGQLGSDIVSGEIGALVKLGQLMEGDLASTLSILPRRGELSAYLYSCVILKSLILSLGQWPEELQASFLSRDCFLIDAFRYSDERLRFTSRVAQGGINFELDDFGLERQKPFVSSDTIATAMSCALKNILPEMPRNNSLVVVSDYFRRISDENSSYSLLMQTNLASKPFTAREIDFMEHVKSQVEDFALLADNKRLRREIASVTEESQKLYEAKLVECRDINSRDVAHLREQLTISQDKNEELERELMNAREESELLSLQFHQMQEELKNYSLDNKLKDEKLRRLLHFLRGQWEILLLMMRLHSRLQSGWHQSFRRSSSWLEWVRKANYELEAEAFEASGDEQGSKRAARRSRGAREQED